MELQTIKLVPRDEVKIKKALRILNEPVTYFGETYEDRRSRLKLLLEKQKAIKEVIIEEEKAQELQKIKGGEDLLQARRNILQYSTKQAAVRVQMQKIISQNVINYAQIFSKRNQENKQAFNTRCVSSQVGDKRCLFQIKFNGNGSNLVTSG